MAATTALAIAGGISAVGSGIKAIHGLKQKNKAEDMFDEFEYPETENVYKDRQVPTSGTEMRVEEASRSMATSVDAMRGTGVRGMAAIPDIQREYSSIIDEAGSRIEQMEFELDRQFAEEEARIRQIEEQRSQQELGGIQQMYAAGEQNLFGGMSDFAGNATDLALGFSELEGMDNSLNPNSNNGGE